MKNIKYFINSAILKLVILFYSYNVLLNLFEFINSLTSGKDRLFYLNETITSLVLVTIWFCLHQYYYRNDKSVKKVLVCFTSIAIYIYLMKIFEILTMQATLYFEFVLKYSVLILVFLLILRVIYKKDKISNSIISEE